MAEWVIGVSQLNEYVRRQLAADPMLKLVRVRGEISGFKRHYSGHLYFSLKDQDARVQCVMFRQSASSLDFAPADGMQVVVTANASLFVRDGTYQLYCELMTREGRGELYLKFEQLKQQLEREGLFDPSIKQPLPMLPRRIGIVTSASGAALHDMIRVARRRNPGVGILLAPAQVQGDGAAADIANAIARLNRAKNVDIILCGRGGGSIEDLWAFNEEIVARAIYASKIPVISCVGHETDFTIADFVADVRAATPSVAAELAVPLRDELLAQLEGIKLALITAETRYLYAYRVKLKELRNSPVLLMPDRMLLAPHKGRYDMLALRLNRAFERRMSAARAALELQKKALAGLNPESVLERGYAVVSGGRGIAQGVSELCSGENIKIIMRDGSMGATITHIDQMEGTDAKT